MGLSDIDEDDLPPAPAPPASAAVFPKGAPAGGMVSLDDLFGPPTHSSAPIAPSQPVYAPSQPVNTQPMSEIDALFCAAMPPPVCAPVGQAPQKMIHVDYDDNEDNLLDLSRPAQSVQHQSLESCLDAFDRRHKPGGRVGCIGADSSQKSLSALTRNTDDNKVKSRLLHLLSYYDVLGVHRDASLDDIKRQYKQLAVSLHPDRVVGGSQSDDEANLFKAITTAYETLSDNEARLKYDAALNAGTAPPLV